MGFGRFTMENRPKSAKIPSVMGDTPTTFAQKGLMVFKIFCACGAEKGRFGPSGPKAPMVFRIFPTCGAEKGPFGPSFPKAPMVFRIFSACGADLWHFSFGPSGPEFSLPAALRKGALCLPGPKRRGCSEFSPPAAPRGITRWAFRPQSL